MGSPKAPPADASLPTELADLTREERGVLVQVAAILRRLRFGNVVLVVQDGKVVQIETAEKFRVR